MLPHGQLVEELRVVGDVGEVGLGGDGVVDDVVPGDEELAQRRRQYAGEGPERGGLAGAVGADQGKDLAGRDGESEAADRHEVAIALVIVFNDDGHALALAAVNRHRCAAVGRSLAR